MSGTPLHSQWDIVIAGAGFSGLVAANIAAKGGLKVLVLERNGEPGGCAAISGGIIWAPESAETLAATEFGCPNSNPVKTQQTDN